MNMYSKVIKKNLSFGDAMKELREEKKIARSDWGGYIRSFYMKAIILAVLKDNAGLAPAQPYQADMLAHDWMVVE